MSDGTVPAELESAARGALAQVTPPETVGALVATAEPAEQVVDLAFDSLLPGYTGWRWTVSVARLPDEAPSVLEVELLPGEGALVAPAWVPWAERLAEYRRAHPDEPVDDAEEDLDDEDDLDADEDVLEEADDDLDGVEFETPADDLEDESDDAEDLDDDEGTDADDDLGDEALHGSEDERLRGD